MLNAESSWIFSDCQRVASWTTGFAEISVPLAMELLIKKYIYIWSKGRLISPSLPVGDDRYLNLSSQKRATGRNLGGNRSVYDALAPRPEVLLSRCFVCACRSLSNSSSYHIRGNEMNCVGSSEYMTVSRHLLVPVSLTYGRISHLVG